MYTKHKSLGKFQGNESEMVAKAVYNASMDSSEVMGDVDEYGYHHSYVEGKRYDYIVTENSQGFVYVEHGDKERIRKQWNGLEKAYLAWYDEAYPNGLNGEDEDNE